MASPYLIYGATGYTGALTARLAVERGDKPVLGGRNERAPGRHRGRAQAAVFAGRSVSTIRRALEQHPAGPQSGPALRRSLLHTPSRPMADACLRTKAHYLDITGEVARLRGPARAGRGGQSGGSDAATGRRLRRRPVGLSGGAPEATATHGDRLALGFQPAALSRGTATTMVENIGRGGLVRGTASSTRAGGLEDAGHRLRRGPEAMTIPWGDVSTAYHSTGIPDIEVYLAAPLVAPHGLTGHAPFSARCSPPSPAQRPLEEAHPLCAPRARATKKGRTGQGPPLGRGEGRRRDARRSRAWPAPRATP